MTDIKTPEERSENMSRIRSCNTRPEKLVRSMIFREGFRFRINSSALPGKPDIVLRKHNAVIFVQGCFWHGHKGCRIAKMPSSRRKFWGAKLAKNRRRDIEVRQELLASGWRVLWVWGCSLSQKSDLDNVCRLITDWIRFGPQSAEIYRNFKAGLVQISNSLGSNHDEN